MLKTYIIPIEAYSYYILYTLSNVGRHSYDITIYQHMICLVFILLTIFILLLMYYDTIYREANNIKRCRDIEKTTQINENLDYPYVYNIYIVREKDKKNVITNNIFYIQYDFVRNKTKVMFTNNSSIGDFIFSYKNNDIDNELSKKAFYYYNLEEGYGQPLEYKTNMGTFYINKDMLLAEKFTFVIARYDNKMIDNDPSAYDLLNFVKKFGFNIDYSNLAPIYNIQYAIENRKNKLSI